MHRLTIFFRAITLSSLGKFGFLGFGETQFSSCLDPVTGYFRTSFRLDRSVRLALIQLLRSATGHILARPTSANPRARVPITAAIGFGQGGNASIKDSL